MRCLITGHRGFLGCALTQKLKRWKGCSIQDGCDIKDLTVKDLKGFDAVVHLAAIVGEGPCSRDPESAYVINAFSTWRLLDLAHLADVKQFVLASTCSLYGDMGESLADEVTVPQPWGVYSTSKFMADSYVSWRGYTVLRFGSLYGGQLSLRERWSLPEVMVQEAKKREITVKDADSWRPLTHVEDATRAILFVLERDHRKTLNVVGENIRKGYLAQLIAERYGAKVKLCKDKGRSYRVSSKRLLDLGFKFEWNVERWLGEEDSFMGASA